MPSTAECGLCSHGSIWLFRTLADEFGPNRISKSDPSDECKTDGAFAVFATSISPQPATLEIAAEMRRSDPRLPELLLDE